MNYWEIYKDVWQFHKDHADIIDSDEYWKKAFNDAKTRAKKHGDTKFARQMLITVLNELDRIATGKDET